MVETTSIYALPQVDSTLAPSGQYAKLSAGGLDFITNYYGAYSPFTLSQSDFVEWQVVTSGFEGTGSPGFRNRQNLIGPAKLRYRMIGAQTTHVRAFPSAYIGTLQGRDETSGVISGQTFAIPGRVRLDGTSLQSQMWDLEQAKAQTGYPCRVDQMPNTTIRWDITRVQAGVENLFIDLYLNDVSDGNNYDMGAFGTTTQARKNLRVPHRDYLDTVNGIEGGFTRSWNMNIWPVLPTIVNSGSNRPDGGWGGGLIVDDINQPLQNIGGRDHHIIFKRENNGSEFEFDYVGLVFANDELAGELNPLAYRDWLINVWPSILQSSAKAQQIWNLARVKPWGAPRMPAGNMMIEGINMGFETWYSAANGNQIAEIDVERLEFEVDGIGTFGYYTPDTGGATGGGGTTGGGTDLGFSRNISRDVVVQESLEIDYIDLHSSGSPISEIIAHPSPEIIQVVRTDPYLEVKALAEGSVLIGFELENGATGSLTVVGVAPQVTEQTAYIGTRYVPAGEDITCDMSRMPVLFGASREVTAVSGDATAAISGDELTISAPSGASQGGQVQIK